MHPIIEAYPEWKKLQKEKEKLATARGIYTARWAKADAENRAALANWKAATDEALLSGDVPPARPKLEDPPGNMDLFVSRQRELVEAERAFLAEHAEEIDLEMVRLHDNIIEDARPRLLELEEAATELRALVGALAQVRGISRPGAPTGLHRGGDYLDVGELARVVVRGESFIRQEPRQAALRD